MSTDTYVEHVRERLASVPDLRFRRMFGGVGVYSGPRMFALIADEQLHLKTDAESRPAFQAAGGTPFASANKSGRITTTSYWRLPASAEEDSREAEHWTRLAREAAGRAARARVGPGAPELGSGPWDG